MAKGKKTETTVGLLAPKAIAAKMFSGTPLREEDFWNHALAIVDSLREGTDDVTAYVMLKQGEQIIDAALEIQKEYAVTRFAGTKEGVVLGAIVKPRAVREYEYDDPELAKLETAMDDLKKKIDERRKMLRDLPFAENTDPTTGETIRKATMTRNGMSIAVSFKGKNNG